jgi:hypothetical protein
VRVRVGWSGEIDGKWQKADVELEEDDVTRLLADNELPEQLRTRLPVTVAYQLLANQAEMLLLNKLDGLGYPRDKGERRIDALTNRNTAILDAIRSSITVAA